MDKIRLFVYGTLRIGGESHSIVAPYVITTKRYQLHGRLYRVGSYPALVWDPAEEGLVTGDLLTVSTEALKPLDEWEDYVGPGHPDNEYERILHPEGFFVYIWSQEKVDRLGLPRIDGGDWLHDTGQKKPQLGKGFI
ncbi:gamma-glutamylcyclotransferase [Brevibacillus humidisoli]|uniref:gamma-glutamylcyclotransferase family protein n=1 Tax=Brevibacillus humidisoli TaxID=2895522 RepID=UPI001E5838BF|nr:gamma-glutamylcyclotransferase family protein [Brevibacillus humidisoli]UFJ39669.1 gamma-glutamylcyclotransferase [Brevibacillus humidisoli]